MQPIEQTKDDDVHVLALTCHAFDHLAHSLGGGAMNLWAQ